MDFTAFERLLVQAESVNPALAYLVLCRGTGGDQRTTFWSVNAICDRTGMTRPSALNAMDVITGRLRGEKFVREVPTKNKRRPRYEIEADEEPDLVWLPNALVDGAAQETSPLTRLRRLGDRGVLWLAIYLYKAQSLADHGGVNWRGDDERVVKRYTRARIIERGPFTVYEFNVGDTYAVPASPFVVNQLDSGTKPLQTFFDRLETLERMGLVRFVPHLVEGDQPYSEIICRLDDRMRDLTYAVATSMIPVGDEPHVGLRHRVEIYDQDFLIPIGLSMKDATVVGILQTTYKAKTTNSARWIAGISSLGEEFRDEMKRADRMGDGCARHLFSGSSI